MTLRRDFKDSNELNSVGTQYLPMYGVTGTPTTGQIAIMQAGGDLSFKDNKAGFAVCCGDGSNPIGAAAIVAAFMLPYDMTITEISIIAPGGNASCEFDVWQDTGSSNIPTIANTIFSTRPALSAAQTYVDTTLTGVTTTLLGGYWIIVKLHSVSSSPPLLGFSVLGKKGAT